MKFPHLGILGMIFITLKLTGHIAWSWLWVLAPFWIPLSIAAVIVLVMGVIDHVTYETDGGNSEGVSNG